MDIDIIIKSFIVGLMVSIPLGPIGVIIIQRTLNRGFISGFFSGMGAAFVDIIYALIAAFGVSIIINFINRHQFYIQILASIILIAIGLQIYLNTTVSKFKAKQMQSRSYINDFLTVFGLTFSNPLALFVFLGVFAGTSLLGNSPELKRIGIVVTAIFCGAMVWWIILSVFVSLFRKKFHFRQLFWINKITGVILTIIGFIILITSFFPISKYFR